MPSPFSILSLATNEYRYYLKDHLGVIRTNVDEDEHDPPRGSPEDDQMNIMTGCHP